MKGIEETIEKLREKYTITDEGKIIEYLGIQLEHPGDRIRISQLLLINIIIDTLPGARKVIPVKYPVLPSVILTKDDNGSERKKDWNYRSVIGILNFLTNSTHPVLSLSVHQYAHFCGDPNIVHE